MEEKNIFETTLESMGIKDVYIDGFTPDQIFFQLEDALSKRFDQIKFQIDEKYKKYIKKINDQENLKKDSASELSSDNYESEKYIEESLDKSVDDENSIDDSDQNESISHERQNLFDSKAEDSEKSDFEEHSSQISSGENNHDEYFCSEQSVSFEADDWNSSYSSCDEIVNAPATNTIKILISKDNKKSKR